MDIRSAPDGKVIALRRDEADWPAIKMIAALALTETGRFSETDIAAALSVPPQVVRSMVEAGRGEPR
ncbi:hypothetical protein [Oricola thermophila]|uniref:Uncharacterized protein n=1 Tax=Oricola thermophila TaxID=2742145 RepID=A0A6N1VCY8_9HYPH|nr:hypothetical protein [Oricola thermophila]QKV18734.1 hypothetical protein HTY61_09875 [Oricola thermophila]